MKNFALFKGLIGCAACSFALFMTTHLHGQSGSRNVVPSAGSGTRVPMPDVVGSSTRVPMPEIVGSNTRNVPPTGSYVAPPTESMMVPSTGYVEPAYSSNSTYAPVPVTSAPVTTSYLPSANYSGGCSGCGTTTYSPTISSYPSFRTYSRPVYGIRSWTPVRRGFWGRSYSSGCSGF